MALADSRRTARQEYSWKETDIPADVFLMQEAILGGKFDVAEAHE